MVDTHHSSKPIKDRSSRVKYNINGGLREIITHQQCRFMDCSKDTILVEDVGSGEGCTWVEGRGTNGNSQYFLVRFAVNLPRI